MKKLVNGIEMDMTPEELAQREKDIKAPAQGSLA